MANEVLADMQTRADLLTASLIDNVCIVLNNMGRGADSLRLCELAMERHVPLTANCYVGLTFGAYASQDASLMRRAVAHIEAANPELLIENPAVFDNTAALHVALGDKAKALHYVKLCKTHGYDNFAAMPTMPDYASIKNDPDFKKLFRR